MIDHIQPIAHVHAIAIYRYRFAIDDFVDDDRNKLLGVLIRTVVVAAVRDNYRQTIGVVIGSNQVITGGFAGRVR